MSKIFDLSQASRTEVTNDFLNETYEEMIKAEPELKDYILDFKPDTEIDGLGEYNPDDRIIKVNPVNIQNSDSVKEYNKRLEAIHTLRHEMEHARNLKRVYEGGSDIESLVVRHASIAYIKRHGLPFCNFPVESEFLGGRVKANYEFDPGERLCDIKAARYVVNLIKNQRRSHDSFVARCMLYQSYIRGYHDNGVYLDAPTYTFLMNVGMFQDYRILKMTVDHTKYSFDSRITYGLPVKYDEMNRELVRKVGLRIRG